MLSLLSPRLWLALALVAVLALTHGFAYRAGRAAVRGEWDKEKAVQVADALKASETFRLKELALNASNLKVTNDYMAQKKLRAADAVVNDGRLRELKAALLASSSDTDTSASGRTDDPRDAIIDQCATSLIGMDQYAKGLALTATGLQRYTREVCLAR